MARLQKKFASTPKSREQILHEQQSSGSSEYDPALESLSYKIMRNAEKPPIGTVFARDMKFDEQYLNYEGTRRIMKLVAIRKSDVEVVFFAGDQREWLKCSVPLAYPLSTDLTGVTPGQMPREKENKVAKKDRKHTGAGKVAKVVRVISEKTGYKEGTVGDLAGIAILTYKTEDKIIEAVTEVVATLFKAKGKSAAKDVTEPRARHIISVLRKEFPARYPSPEKSGKTEKTKFVKAKKTPVAA